MYEFQEVKNERDMLDGNLNRMFVVDNEDELQCNFIGAVYRLNRIYKKHEKRILKEKHKQQREGEEISGKNCIYDDLNRMFTAGNEKELDLNFIAITDRLIRIYKEQIKRILEEEYEKQRG